MGTASNWRWQCSRIGKHLRLQFCQIWISRNFHIHLHKGLRCPGFEPDFGMYVGVYDTLRTGKMACEWTGCWDAWNERVIGFDLFQGTFFICVLGLRKNYRNSVSDQSISVPAYHSHCYSPPPPGWQTLKVTTNLINTFPTNRHFASTFPSHEPLLSDNNWSCLLLLWAERYSQRRKADRLAQNDSIPLSEFSSTY
jgi:hypothetical protein